MNAETDAIYSSTGAVGVSNRQYDRLYVNGVYASDFDKVSNNFNRLINIGNSYPDKIGRCVYRGIVPQGLVEQIAQNGLRQNLEVAFPIGDFTNDNDSWLIYMASNNPNRNRIVPQQVMIEETKKLKGAGISPEQRVLNLTKQGLSFVNQIDEQDIGQVEELWGETFGWNHQEIKNLGHRLVKNHNIWFAAVKDNEKIVSLAMAEKISIPKNGGVLDLIESTEWKTRAEYSGRGIMSATLAVLNSQILSDKLTIPLIYAECNYQSRADLAASGAGFRIPERDLDGNPAPQILIQNVKVNDGQVVDNDKLRDFTFMYLPKDTIVNSYTPQNIRTILEVINK